MIFDVGNNIDLISRVTCPLPYILEFLNRPLVFLCRVWNLPTHRVDPPYVLLHLQIATKFQKVSRDQHQNKYLI